MLLDSMRLKIAELRDKSLFSAILGFLVVVM